MKDKFKIGIDYGGTKIEAILMNDKGDEIKRERSEYDRNYESGVSKIFINGELATTKNLGENKNYFSSDTLIVGKVDNYFKGIVREVLLFSKDVAQTDINKIHQYLLCLIKTKNAFLISA